MLLLLLLLYVHVTGAVRIILFLTGLHAQSLEAPKGSAPPAPPPAAAPGALASSASEIWEVGTATTIVQTDSDIIQILSRAPIQVVAAFGNGGGGSVSDDPNPFYSRSSQSRNREAECH